MIQRNWAESWKAKLVAITIAEQKKWVKRNEDSLRHLQNNIKCVNICILRVPKEKWDRKGAEDKFKDIIAENFPKVGKEMLNKVLEAQKYPFLSRQDKPKEERAETHSNQTDKNKRQR